MSAATTKDVEIGMPAPVTCIAEGGCSYLRALATIERLAGFDQSAQSYAQAAFRCQRFGCWAAAQEGACPPRKTGDDGLVPLDPIRSARRSESAAPLYGGAQAPIPFIRSSMIDAISDPDGNYVERRSLKLATLPKATDALGYLYRYWCGLRGETECQFANIDTVHLMRAGIIGSMHVVDVSCPDPQEFRFELTGYAVPLGPFEKPRALPVSIYADTTMSDYNTVRLTGAPRLQRVRARLGGTSHHYTRLVLPFFDTRGGVDRLVVAIRQERGNGVYVKAGE